MACSFFYNGENYTKQELIKLIQEEKIADNQRVEINYTQYDQEPLRALFNISPNETLEDYLKLNYEESLNKARLYNRDAKYTFSEDVNSSFDPSINTMNISLSEIFNMAIQNNIDFKEYLDYFINHELDHVVTLAGSLSPNFNKKIEDILNEAREAFVETGGFIDSYRGGFLFKGFPYGLTNIEELLADYDKNKDFKAWLKTIKSKNSDESLWEKILNLVRGLIGLGPVNSLYKEIDNIVNSENFRLDGQYILDNFPEEFQSQKTFGLNKIWFNTKDLLISQYGINPELKNLFENLPKVTGDFKRSLTSSKDSQKIALLKLRKQLSLNKNPQFTQYYKDKIAKYEKDLNYLDKTEKNLNSLINNLFNSKDTQERVKTLISILQSAYLISVNIETDMNNILKSNIDLDDKALLMYTLNIQAESLDILKPTIIQLSKILRDPSLTDFSGSAKFVSQISLIENIKNQVSAEYIKFSKKATALRFSIEEVDSELAIRLKNLIDTYKLQITQTTDENLIQLLNKRIEQTLQQLNKIPTRNVVEAILRGEVPDASLMDLQLQSMALNSHSLIQSASKMINDNDNLLAARRLEKNNIMQSIMSSFKKAVNISSFRNIENDITNKITVPVTLIKRIYKDVDGSLKEEKLEQRMFITDYSPEYITDFDRIQSYINYYEEERRYNRNLSDKEAEELNSKISELYEKKFEFLKTHQEGYYKEEYYKHKDILNEKIKGVNSEGETVELSLNDVYRELFDRIEIQERHKTQTVDSQELIEISEELDNLWNEYSEISSPYTNTGVEKEGIDKLIALQAVKYKEERNKVGSRIFTESDELSYNALLNSFETTKDIKIRGLNRDKLIIKEQLDKNKISEPEYEAELKKINRQEAEVLKEFDNNVNSIQQTKPTELYFKEREFLQNEVERLRLIIMNIPEIAEPLGGVEELKKLSKENYKKLADLSKSYRDNDGSIDGIAFTKNKPEAVRVVKEIQEAERDLSKQIRRFSGLSFNEIKEYYNLRFLKNKRTSLQQDRYNELKSIKDKSKAARIENSDIFEEYENALSRLMELSTPENTKYYKLEYNNQRNALRISLENEANNDLDQFLSDFDLTLNKNGTISKFKTNPDGTITEVKKYQNKLEAISTEISFVLDDKFKESDWYINNHYQREEYKGQGNYETIDYPIYIWVKQIPKNIIHQGEPEPLFIFKSFIVHDDYINKNHKLIYPGLSVPKKSSPYYNTKNISNLNSLPSAYKELYNKLRDFYHQTQEDAEMSDNEKMYDILPSIPKTNQENKIDFVNNLFKDGLGQTIKNFWDTGLGKIDDDSQIIQDGSIKKIYSKNKLIPYRFNNKMDKSIQSSDLFSMLLIYDNINSDVLNKTGLEEIFQTAITATKDIPVITEKLSSGSFNIMNIINRIKNKSKSTKITSIDHNKENVLNATLRHIADTHLYNETKTDATFTVLGQEMDGHKIVSSIKKFSSNMIFGGFKWFGPTKNMLSTIINGFIQTELSQGFASKADYAKAVAIAPTKFRDIIKNYRKVGNKTHFGQAMDYFKVLHGGIYDEYGKVVQWTALSEFNLSNAAIIKNSLELNGQITTFLSISYANMVEINGRKVPFHEAFETKNNKFVPIDGALYNGKPITQNDINLFIGKISNINRRLNGSFRLLDKSKFEKNIFGSLTFYLNAFVMPGIKSRYGNYQYLSEADITLRGYYRDGIEFLIDGFKNFGNFTKVWHTLSKEEQNRVRMFSSEMILSMMFSLAVLALSAGGGDTKKKLKKNNPLFNYLFALTMGVGSEIQTFVPTPGLGGDEFIRKIVTPFASVRQIATFYKSLIHFMEFIGGGGRYKVKTIDDGLHDKGDLKFIADFVSFTGWSMREWDSVEKVIQVKKSQQLR